MKPGVVLKELGWAADQLQDWETLGAARKRALVLLMECQLDNLRSVLVVEQREAGEAAERAA